MKNIAKLIISLCLVVCLLSGCVEEGDKVGKSFEVVETGKTVKIFREVSTNVLYFAYHRGDGAGLTIMLDADGKPLTYENWKK